MSDKKNDEYDKLFRIAAFGGFNKQDVLAYIDRMIKTRKKDNEKFYESVKQSEIEKKEIKEKLEAASSDLEKIDAECIRLREDNIKAGDLTAKLKMEKDALESYNSAMKEEILAAASQIKNYEDKVSQMETRLQENEDDEASIRMVYEKKLCDAAELQTQRDMLADRVKILEDELAENKTTEKAECAPIENAEQVNEKPSIDALKGQNSELLDRIHEMQEKIRRYEREKLKINLIEDSAYEKAKRIESEATQKAEMIRTESIGHAAEFVRKFDLIKEQLTNAKSMLQKEVGKTSDVYTNLIEEAEKLHELLDEKDALKG